ncbi:MAG: hypothetical protein DRQ55_07795 [Planctomycetota bacterium]|nr:MAG: hypothetical protein DRQ55_07795 [Planctomycetota bacterium]
MRSPFSLILALPLGLSAVVALWNVAPGAEGAVPAPAGGIAPPAAQVANAPDLIVVPHLPAAARQRLLVAGQVLIDNPDPAGRSARVTGLRLARADRPQQALFATDLSLSLRGDPEFSAIGAMVERLPEELVGHRSARPDVYGPANAPPLTGDAAIDAWHQAVARLDALSARLGNGEAPSFGRADVQLPLWMVFDASDAPGTERELLLDVSWTDADGAAHTQRTRRPLTLLPPWRGVPPALAAGLPGLSLHAGDLHVHSCHGEASGACAPSGDCGAESLQTSGSFSYAQLKSQYQALGLDWFSATDHSYCINSEAEYQAIVAECAAITDASFVAMPDTELSSDEEGPQVGSDLGDLLCLIATSANHMGAHGITHRHHGGSPEFWGFCDGFFTDELDPFLGNIAEIRADGGWPVAHHPMDDSFGWNSFAATSGMESNGLQGVEIWNGAESDGLGGHVQRWVDWMLAGRVLFAYSGSDTHDEAFAFGANRALLMPGESFSLENISAAVRNGRSFVSNGHTLILELLHDGQSLGMGTIQTLVAGQTAPTVSVRAHYDFGPDTATVTLFSGRVGDASESIPCQSSPLTGSGVFECVVTVDPDTRSWYRLYSSTASGSLEAYSNPVFFQPGGCSHVPYGTLLGAPHVGNLSSSSSPALGAVNTLSVTGFDNSSTAYLIAGLAPEFSGIPFKAGKLLVSLPLALQVPAPLTGGAFDVVFQMPADPALVGAVVAWQAIAPDATQPKGFAFSNGLLTTVCSPF